MLVVSDTSPIISLLKVGRLGLLERLFGKVLIPDAVYQELTGDERFAREADAVASSSYIDCCRLADEAAAIELAHDAGIDIGEAEAICLAQERAASLLLIDDALGRATAEKAGLDITGTVGLLGRAYKRQLLSAQEIRECIEVLRENKRHISAPLYDYLLIMIEEDL